MSKITQSAKNEDCTIRLPGVCNHDSATTVFCHISGIRFGHGIGIKTEFGAYGCSSCHDLVDGRVRSYQDPNIIKLAHYEGAFETMIKLDNKGLINL